MVIELLTKQKQHVFVQQQTAESSKYAASIYICHIQMKISLALHDIAPHCLSCFFYCGPFYHLNIESVIFQLIIFMYILPGVYLSRVISFLLFYLLSVVNDV